MNFRFAISSLCLAASVLGCNFEVFAQGNQHKIKPSPAQDDDTLSVTTEEIKLNVLARNDYGHFDPTLVKDDLMVVEDRVPHSIVSLERRPASVLIVLDTGGELRFAKSLQTTVQVALGLIKDLNETNQLALMQYSDKAEILCEWTTDKNLILDLLAKKADFGKRSRFVEAMNLAAKFMQSRPNENRHLVLITDGTDSASDKAARENALKNLLAANVSVHVLSYTQLEQQAQNNRSILQGGGTKPRGVPNIPGADNTQTFPIFTVNLDREMIRKARERQAALRTSQTELETLAKETGGTMILPKKPEDMILKAKEVAGTIDSQYVVTYIPRRALSNSPAGEIREVEIISRRVGLVVQSRRKVVVPRKENQ